MILEIKKLMARAAYTGDFSFDYQPPQGSMLIPLCRFKGSIKVSGSYEIFEGDEVEVKLNVAYGIVGQCSYCLAEAEKSIESTAEVLFVIDKNDVDNYYYDGNRLDLSTAVNDLVLFSQPSILLCKEDCAGVKL